MHNFIYYYKTFENVRDAGNGLSWGGRCSHTRGVGHGPHRAPPGHPIQGPQGDQRSGGLPAHHGLGPLQPPLPPVRCQGDPPHAPAGPTPVMGPAGRAGHPCRRFFLFYI